jgi:membrane fusion protein, copper/silver efflux system
MGRTSYSSLFGGIFLGLFLACGAAGVLYWQGFRLAPAATAPVATEHRILCYKSPTDPAYMSDKPGQDPQGHELIPVYADESPAAAAAAKPKAERKIKYWVSPMEPTYIRNKPGKAPCGMDLVPVYEDEAPAQTTAVAPEKKGKKIKYWVSPMEPSYIRNKPGKAPCGMDLVPVYEEEGEAPSAGGISVAPNILQTMGVRTAKVEVRDLSRTIRAVGKVIVDEKRLAQITTKINGWVDKLYVNATGEPVRKGQTLLSIYSPELVSAQEEYLLSLKSFENQQKSSFPELAESGKRLLEASRRRLSYWDIGPSQIDALERTGDVKKSLTLTSPVNGIVIQRLGTAGMYVKAGMPVLEVADLSQVWVEADIYQYELPWVKLGQTAVMTLDYLPGKTFQGRVNYIYPYLEGKTRTAKVRLIFDNPSLELKPEMFAQVILKSPLRVAAVAVPSEAVINTGQQQHVFLALGKGQFKPQEVKLGLEAQDGWWQVLSGLKGGEEVVTSGQFLLDSESRFREAAAMFLKETEAPKPGPAPMPAGQHH